ncbi:hypothetical protein ACFT2C_15800 [Promicromonospora sp. NPDC057138]|uniref:hypothetical protein n=1 Tax=Promicromonospora sp. NPDC057138 TaxID=3346031 RepID=UPI00364251E4
MRNRNARTRSIVLLAGLMVGLTAGTTATAVAGPASVACSAPSAHVLSQAAAPSDCDPVGTPVTLGKPTPGATANWQKTKTNGVGYKIPAQWTGHKIVGDGGKGHEWESPKVIISDEFGDLHWRILVQSPFVDQTMPDPEELNELGYYASYIEVDGASEAVLVAAQTGHWADPSVKTIDFQVFVESERTGVVTRFMGELPPGKRGQFLLNNFVPTIKP